MKKQKSPTTKDYLIVLIVTIIIFGTWIYCIDQVLNTIMKPTIIIIQEK